MENRDENTIHNFLSTKEAAEHLDYTVQHTRLLIRNGELKATKFGRDWMVVRESVVEYKINNQEENR